MMKYFYYPLLGKNNVSVYPFDYSLVDTFCFDTKEKPSSVLYITDSIDDEVAEHGKTCFMRENRTNECKEEDISLITGLPNAFHEKYKGDVKVVKFDSLYKLVDYSKVEEIDISALNISVTDVEVDKKENACITISFSEETKMYHNENGYALSYHVISEDYEVYDNPRKELGELIVGDYTLDYNLSEIKNTATIIVDVIEEGVQWYSYHGKVPAVTFIKNGDEWNYSVEMIDLR